MPILALVGVEDYETFESLQNPIVKVVRLQHARPEHIIQPGFSLDGALVMIGPTPAESMKIIPQFRLAHPSKPVFVAGENLTVDEAVELIHAGVTDVITLPVDPPVLKHKLMREFLGIRGPAAMTPVLKMFAPDSPAMALPPPPRPFNRQRARRADVPPQTGARVRLTAPNGNEGDAAILNFSTSMGGRPGGARLRCDPEAAAALDVFSWPGKAAVKAVFHLPEVPPIPATANVVPPIRRVDAEGTINFAIQYTLDRLEHAGAVRRFWTMCWDRSTRPTEPWFVPTL